jgi:hypothetical protein
MLQGVLIDEAVEMRFQSPGHFGRSTGARALSEALHALVGKAVDPLAEGGIGHVKRLGDRLEAPSLDDVAHGLGPAEAPGLFGLFDEGI